ncbi:PP2C family protein-serine/threonine phosphatase [Actinosynnema sp. CS-041913]|uniref:PP2C family protein-serine/threonine phosphatase n=1 Tax=Actinosynnema sp. CS-041913 TaxID=3239917 RepID=UPI003D94514A
MSTTRTVTVHTATHIGARSHQCDATATATGPDGTTAVALIDGIGSNDTVAATVPLLAEVAARVGARRGALAGLLAAAELVSSGTADITTPNAVGVLAVTYPDGETSIAHCGDTRAYSLDPRNNLSGHTADHTVAQMLRDHGYHGSTWDLDAHVRTTLARATVASITTTSTRDPLVILTSDGIHKPLTDPEIATLTAEHPHPRQLADHLVTAALAGPQDEDGPDNTTTAVIHIR